MKSHRVLLADDQTLFRKAVAALLASSANFEVVGEAEDGIQAIEKARELRPDLILMDVRMPRCSGIEATRQIRAELPNVKIVILTVSDEEEDLFEAIKCGAQGYLLKNLRPEALFEYLEGVFRGEVALTPAVATKVLGEFLRLASQPVAPTSALESLTPREREILKLVAQGASNKEIASTLNIVEGTVKNHLHHVLEKLHLRNRAQAAASALRDGLLPAGNKTPKP